MTTSLARYRHPLLAIAGLAALLVGISGPGYRLGVWPLPVAFGLFRWGGYVAIAVTVVAGAAFVAGHRARTGRAVMIVLGATIAIGLATASAPLRLLWLSKQAPPIHDITTDTAHPPPFVSIAPLRTDARNPMTYDRTAAARQTDAYPLVKTLTSTEPPERQFPRALAAAREMGWTIVASVPAEGRIEATDTTPFFGFTDDIVIRVAADGAGSRVDVRSLSRVGKSDLGTNAARVGQYLWKLKLHQP